MNKTIFTEDLPKKQLNVERIFNAPLDMVWMAWTDSTLLDQWWAPEPWKAETKFMDFREGGYWLYSMNGPAGEQQWSRADYDKIKPNESFTGIDSFCDQNGHKNKDLPGMHWYVKFIRDKSVTKVNVQITFASEKDLKTIVEMGFKEGFSMAHDNLDKWLIRQTA